MHWSKSKVVSTLNAIILGSCVSAPLPVKATPQPQTPTEVHSSLPSDGLLKTDRDVYTASCQGEGYTKVCEFTLVMTYTNSTDATIYLSLCNPDDTYPIYGILGPTNEESAYNRVWACAGHDRAIKVSAGEKRVNTLEISGPNVWDETGKPFAGAFEGRLQISYDAYTCADEYEACALPDEVATSNLFEVRLP